MKFANKKCFRSALKLVIRTGGLSTAIPCAQLHNTMANPKSSSTSQSEHKKTETSNVKIETKKRGWDEIDNLFEDRKKEKLCKRQEQQKMSAKITKKRQNNISRLSKTSSPEWTDDGLGGIYDSEGYTGRIEDGVKVFKAHVLRKPNSGQTPDCPFDCDCCFI